MDLWNQISGVVRIELTAADPNSFLNEGIRRGMIFHDVQFHDGIRCSFRIGRSALATLGAMAKKESAQIHILKREGLAYWVAGWGKRPVLTMMLLMLLAASLWLPGRILFVRVVGNETVPQRLILEKAEECGLQFGMSRRSVRSERIKNELLGTIEDLEWVGVNTSGSVATIQVRERAEEPEQEESKYCHVIAGVDAIVEEVTMIRGELECKAGQLVRKGDVLISGLMDLGICQRLVEAEGEIYGLTHHEMRAVTSQWGDYRQREGEVVTKYSLLLGKKRINLYSDSGILMPTCGKMKMTYQLHLPGGLTLPVAIVVEHYTLSETSRCAKPEGDVQTVLSAALSGYLQESMVAGKILAQRTDFQTDGETWVMTGSYECREMIARQSEGVYLQEYG